MDKDDSDLPLSANIMDVRVRHHIFLLKPSFSSKIIYGKVILVLSQPTVCEKKGKCCSNTCGCSFSNLGIGLKCVEGCNCSDKFDSILDFRVILDSRNVCIHYVAEVVCDQKDLSPYLDPMFVKEDPHDSREWFNYEKNALQFEVNDWSMQFWKTGVQCVEHFPAVICIEYHTLLEGNSISWRNDADSNLCFFVSGSTINNRSLFPYQDAPSAMATWEANVLTEASYYVSMTGDKPASLVKLDTCAGSLSCFDLGKCLGSGISSTVDTQHDVMNCSYYFTALPLPMATIAIAVGKWNVHTVITPDQMKQASFKCMEQNCKQFMHKDKSSIAQVTCHHSPYPCIIRNTLKNDDELGSNFASSSSGPEEYQESESCGTLMPDHHYHHVLLPTTVVFPNSLKYNVGPLVEFLPHCLSAASQLFGPHPCQRLEVVILPTAFSSLGLASPNLVFLSPSIVIAGDTLMFIRIAHEISHSWFGIIIGAEDWTEEWLSEGFATFAEEAIFEKSCSTFLRSLGEVEQSPSLHQENNHTRIPMPGQQQECLGAVTVTNTSAYLEQFCAFEPMPVTIKEKCCVQSTSSEVVHHKSILPQARGQKRSYSGLLAGHKETKYSCSSSLIAERVMSGDEYSLCSYSSCKPLHALINNHQLALDLALLRTHMHFRNLLQEIEVSAKEMQTLQPNKPGGNLGIVPNALQHDKVFLKVHYIKGYFLLKYLSNSVGVVDFLNFLKAYVLTYHGQLVTASDFVEYFYSYFPQFSEVISKVELVDLWLQQPGINNIIRNQFGNINNHLIDLCQEHCQYWIMKNRKSLKSKSFPKALQFSDQILLFLEYLVEHKQPLKKSILSKIENVYSLDEGNSEIRHSWCELIIKHKFYARSELVCSFLKNEFAMGVYLYGELMIARSKVWKNLARTVFEEVKDTMDINARTEVQEMINPE